MFDDRSNSLPTSPAEETIAFSPQDSGPLVRRSSQAATATSGAAQSKTARHAPLAVRQRLRAVLNDLLNDEELVYPGTSPDPQLSRALQHFRSDPSALLDTLDAVEQEEPSNPADAALIVLQRTFEAAVEEEGERRADPFKFDPTALLLQGCQTFVDFVHDFCGQAELSLRNISPFLATGDGSLGDKSINGGLGESASDIERPTSSLIEQLAVARDRVSLLSRNLISFCTFVVRLQDQSKARLELSKRLDFLFGNVDKLAKDDRLAVGEALCREVEVRLEQRVMQNFIKSAKKALGADHPAITSFNSEWRRSWEDRKQDAADRALRLSDIAIAKVNEALVAFAVGTSTNTSNPSSVVRSTQNSKQQRVPSAPLRNHLTPKQLQLEAERHEKVVERVTGAPASLAPLSSASLDATFASSFEQARSVAEHRSLLVASRQSSRSGVDSAAKKRNAPDAATLRAALARPKQLLAAALSRAEREEQQRRELEATLAAKDAANFNRVGVLGVRGQSPTRLREQQQQQQQISSSSDVPSSLASSSLNVFAERSGDQLLLPAAMKVLPRPVVVAGSTKPPRVSSASLQDTRSGSRQGPVMQSRTTPLNSSLSLSTTNE